MKMGSRLLRNRFCIQYLLFLIIIFTLSAFIVVSYHSQPKGSEFVSELRLFSSWKSNGDNVPIGDGDVRGSSHVARRKRKICNGDKTAAVEGILPELPVKRARHDSRRILRIYDFFSTGAEWENLMDEYDICLSTQSSVERLYWLPQVLENWKGPLSLAIYITNEEEWLVLNIFKRFLDHCYTTVREQVSIHVAVPAAIGPFCYEKEVIQNLTTHFGQFSNSCDDPKSFLNHLLHTFPVPKTNRRKLALKEVYPQNHMRNIARKACATPWTMSTDVDIIPSKDMSDLLQEFYEYMKNDPCKKCAFVIPTFELDERMPFPHNKTEIVEHYNSGFARQFHGTIVPEGHNATNFLQWSTTNLDDDEVKVSHPIIGSQTRLYEPFYVSSDLVPPFDERFMGYGFTRSSQFQEAIFAGWNFSVLTPVFSIHWGLQSTETLLSPKKRGVGENVRKSQASYNRKLFMRIVKELELKKEEGLY